MKMVATVPPPTPTQQQKGLKDSFQLPLHRIYTVPSRNIACSVVLPSNSKDSLRDNENVMPEFLRHPLSPGHWLSDNILKHIGKVKTHA